MRNGGVPEAAGFSALWIPGLGVDYRSPVATLAGSGGRLKSRTLRLAFALAAATSAFLPPARAQAPIRVLFLGGGTTSHDPAAMRDAMVPVLERSGMQVAYRANESVLHADSLARFDAMFVYNAKKGSRTDGTPDLTKAQEDALYAWVEAGHGVVAAHGATSSYLENPRWAELLGASYTEHGDDLAAIAIVEPGHPSQAGVKPPTAWDEGRLHRLLKQDLTILATANAGKTPWTWVRPQGKGWVYYTCSGHDNRVWSDPEYQKQLVQALLWAYAATRGPTALRPAGSGPAITGEEPGADALGRRLPAGPGRDAIRARFAGGHAPP